MTINSDLLDLGSAFRECSSLTRVDFNGCAATTIPSYMFCGVGQVELHGWNNIRTIDPSAFRDSNIEEIDLSHITSIKEHAFRGCKNLRRVTFMDITSIADSAFYACPQHNNHILTIH